MSAPRTATRPRRRPAVDRSRGRARSGARRRPVRGGAARGRSKATPWWAIALLPLLGVALLVRHDEPDDVPLTTAECVLPVTGVQLSDEQMTNARTIAQVAGDRGLTERAVIIALATAMQESTLRNLDHGDRDSLGLFQQRPSQGWGTPEQVQDPVYAAGEFYDHLVQVPDWQTGRLTEVSQAVQRSGFPEAYQQHEPMAAELATVLDDATPCA